MSDSSPGPGWWQASDSKWYPPELHPSVTEAARREAPDTAAPSRRRWVGGGGGSPKPLYRRVWFIALAAVVGLLVAIVIYPSNKTPSSGSTNGTATTAVTQASSAVTTATTTATTSTTLGSGAPSTAAATGGAGTCTATISNPTPSDGGAETILVTSNIPDTAVTATIYYETTTSQYPGITSASGSASIAFGVGQATVGDTVTITVVVGSGATCTTSFTPQ
jgi:hypothetical protein